MNNSYFKEFPGNPIYVGNNQTPNQSTAPNYSNMQKSNIQNYANFIPDEESYIENILRLNRGKKVSVYQSFADAGEWKDRIFTGIIEQSGKDHIILSDPTTGNWYLLLMIYVDFIKFEEKINISQEFYPQNGENTTTI